MAITLTRVGGGAVTTGILLALDVAHDRTIPTHVHELVTGGTVTTVGTAPSTRSGTWRYLCQSRTVANSVEALHLTPGRAITVTVTDPTMPAETSTYLAVRTRLRQATAGSHRWIVDVTYQGIA